MKNILRAITSFFSKVQYSLGALESPQDSRTISAVAVQASVTLPDEYSTVTPPVEDQGTSPMCVAEAVHELKEVFMIAKGTYVGLSAADLYAQCKANDGIPNTPGTYPLVALKLAVSSGIASSSVYGRGDTIAIAADRANYRLGGFVSVPTDFQSVCQAIFQNKAVAASFNVDNNWFLGIITKVIQAIGRHYTLLYGFKVSATIVHGENSWGINWIGKVASYINPNLAPGHFDVYWPDVMDSVTDIYAATDSLPAPVLNHVQSLNYHFNTSMNMGDQTYDVIQLQKRLAQEGLWPAGQAFTGYYGSVTAAHVFAYQMANKVITDATESNYGAICGPKTIRMLNGEVGLDEVSAQIQVESQGNDYAVGDLTLANHAYGCLQIRQGLCDDLNARYGTTYQASATLGNRPLSLEIRAKYFTEAYPQFATWEERAMAWNGGPGYQQNYGKAGYTKYTAELDAYVAKMAAFMA